MRQCYAVLVADASACRQSIVKNGCRLDWSLLLTTLATVVEHNFMGLKFYAANPGYSRSHRRLCLYSVRCSDERLSFVLP